MTRQEYPWFRLTRILLLIALAGCCTTVLYTRVYSQFDRMRIKLVSTERPSSQGIVSVTLQERTRALVGSGRRNVATDPERYLPRLAGTPVAIVLRLGNGEVSRTVAVSINDSEIGRIVLLPEQLVRVDFNRLNRPSLRSGDKFELRSNGDGWSLHSLEISNTHGFSRGHFSFVITPFSTDRYDYVAPSTITSLLVFGVLLLLSLSLLRFDQNKIIRFIQAAVITVILSFFCTILSISMVSKYQVLLSISTFWLCAGILYLPVCLGQFLRILGAVYTALPNQIHTRISWVFRIARARFVSLTEEQKVNFYRLLSVFGLTALVVPYPLFGVLTQSPEFFAARNTKLSDVIILAFVLCVVLPGLIVMTELAVEKINKRAAKLFRSLILVLLTVAMVLPWLKDLGSIDLYIQFALALTAGIALAIGYHRVDAVRLFIVLLSPATIVVPILFILNADVRGALIPTNQAFVTPKIEQAPPIVFVVFDEFPLNSLLNENYEIDSGRYPHFATLAENGYWFRNTSTVSSQTMWALPAILSGTYPTARGAVPTRRYYPNNAFTVLSGQYQMTVFGRFLQLCPPSVCTYDQEVPPETLTALMADLGMVWLHIVLPEPLTKNLPTIVGDWRGFAKARYKDLRQPNRDERMAQFDRFLMAIDGSLKPRFNFLHSMFPHMPFDHVPSGQRYTAPDYQGTQEQGRKLFEGASANYADMLHQRHLLQVGFVDNLVGRLLDHLKKHNVYDETLIIITADHGSSFREGVPRRALTSENYSDIMLVPLFIKLPGQKTGIISDRNVETIDILPTIASILSIELPFNVDGRSLFNQNVQEKDGKTFIQRSLRKSNLMELDDGVANSYLSLQRKVERFGTRTQHGLYSTAGTTQLLGNDISTFRQTKRSRVKTRLSNPAKFSRVDLAKGRLPLYVRGTVRTRKTDQIRLAIAVNGRIAATTQPYKEKGKRVFATLIPEEYLKDGPNDLKIFVIGRNKGRFVLRSTD